MIEFGPEKIKHEVKLSGRTIGTLENRDREWCFCPAYGAGGIVRTEFCDKRFANRRVAKSAIRKELVERVEDLRREALDDMLDKRFPVETEDATPADEADDE